jgi:polyisoprenoid-binding protein YceI
MTRTWVAAALLGLGAGARAQTPAYTIDPTHTFVHWEVQYLGLFNHRGRFERQDGSVEFDRAARSGRVEITIGVDSLSSGSAFIDGMLRGKEFLDAAANASARFVGERWVFKGNQVTEVHGELTLRGVTQPLALKARRFNCYTNPLFRREVCGGDFDAVIQRSRFGIAPLAPGLADEVRLLVQIEAIRQ